MMPHIQGVKLDPLHMGMLVGHRNPSGWLSYGPICSIREDQSMYVQLAVSLSVKLPLTHLFWPQFDEDTLGGQYQRAWQEFGYGSSPLFYIFACAQTAPEGFLTYVNDAMFEHKLYGMYLQDLAEEKESREQTARTGIRVSTWRGFNSLVEDF